MVQWVLETSWWYAAGVILSGLLLAWRGLSTRRRIRPEAWVVLGLGIAWLAAGQWIVTPRERAESRVRAMVKSFEAGDWTAFTSTLDPATTLSVLNGGVTYGNREAIVKGAKAAHERYGVSSVVITGLEAEQSGSVILVSMTLFATEQTIQRPFRTSWQVEFQERAEGWLMMEVRAIEIGEQRGSGAAKMLP